MRANNGKEEGDLVPAFVRRATESEAPILAGSLYLYAAGTGLSWAELARSLGTDEKGLNHLASCRPPRVDHFAEDAAAIADAGGADQHKLIPLLRQIQTSPSSANLAAETRADYETSQDSDGNAEDRP